ncbi:MAG TPA: DUF3048 domain-containing protein, partial [Candidatus Saccharimonadales bacterium]|nr:DUF3048 domain-containing protein [Candidatus Saccharimonadales bacterium]
YRRRWVQLTAVAVVLLLAGGGVWWKLVGDAKPAPKPQAVVAKPKPPAPIYDPLTGLKAPTKAAAQQPVIGVMIENLYPDARPQSGLGEAGVVYEALAEGGITRFLAIFQEPLPPSIGPVRSLRPYYLDWGLEYGIPVAHAGGSQPALEAVPTSGLKDINALVYDGSYFFRTTDRAAPHNLYTNAQDLSALDTKLGFASAPTFKPLPRKADKPEAKPTHPTIKINFSSEPYSVQYNFNPTADDYLRIMGGTPHIERNTGQQIQVKNVVVEFVPTSYATQADGKPETDMNLIGQGQALVFEDGGVTQGTWNKSSDSAQTQLLDASGKPIAFNRGTTWYEVVPTITTVSY